MRRAWHWFFLLQIFGVTFCTAGPYQEPPKPEGWTARAMVLPPQPAATDAARQKAALAVEVLVAIRDFLPRDMEPTLWIGDLRADTRSRVVKVEGGVTTLGFLVENPKLLREDAPLAVQTGEDAKTRAAVPGGTLKLDRIAPADPAELRRFNLPAVKDWLRSG